MPQKRYFSCSAVMISKCLTRVQKAWFQSVLHVYKKHDFKVSYMCTKSTISKCLTRVQKARFQSVLHVYKKHVHMYKMVHLQTSLGCNQCHCAQKKVSHSLFPGNRAKTSPQSPTQLCIPGHTKLPFLSCAREQDHISPSFSTASNSWCVYN